MAITSCDCGQLMQGTQGRIRSYREMLAGRGLSDEEFRRSVREYLNDDRWWHRYLELSHLAYCCDGGLGTLQKLREHWGSRRGASA